MVHQQDKGKEMYKWQEAHWLRPRVKTKSSSTDVTSWKPVSSI